MPVTVSLPSVLLRELYKQEMEDNLTDLRDAVNLAKMEIDITTSASYNAGVKQVILMDATAGTKTVNLPAAASSLDLIYVIKKTDAGLYHVLVKGNGAELIDGVNEYHIQNSKESLTIICNGTSWEIITHKKNALQVTGTKITTTTVVNSAAETLLYSHTFPADTLVASENIINIATGSYSNESPSDDFTMTVKINGVAFHTLARIGTGKTDAGWKLKIEGTIRTAGVSGTFVDIAGLSDGDNMFTEAFATELVIDTTIPTVYEVFVQWDVAKAGNTLSCTQANITLGGA